MNTDWRPLPVIDRCIATVGGLMLAVSAAAAPGALPSPPKDDPADWRALVEYCPVPAGESAAALVREAIGFLGSPDTVLLRSFSALDLSVFAALELQAPSLDEAGYRQLLDAAFDYLREERAQPAQEPLHAVVDADSGASRRAGGRP